MPGLPLLVPAEVPWSTNELLAIVGASHERYEQGGRRRHRIALHGCVLETFVPFDVADWLESLGAIRQLGPLETLAIGESLAGIGGAP